MVDFRYCVVVVYPPRGPCQKGESAPFHANYSRAITYTCTTVPELCVQGGSSWHEESRG